MDGADVTIRSDQGQLNTTTDYGPARDFPYYKVDLSSPPLSVSVGDVITVSAIYSGRTGTEVHSVVADGQQVDVITVAPGGVDLTIQSIAIDPPQPALGQPVTITLTIYDQGDVDSSGFYTHLYIDPPQEPPGPSDLDTSRTYIYGLPAEVFYQWSFRGYTLTQGCHTVWAWVDRDNVVTESDEGNNLSHVQVQTCVPDAYEEDDVCADAVEISTDGAVHRHNLCPGGDTDWVQFDAVEGVTYAIDVSRIGAGAEVLLWLYDECGGAPIAGPSSEMVWQAAESGTYYVRAEYRDEGYGLDTEYEIAITASADCPGDVYEPDDTCALARDIPVDGTRQTRLFCDEGDEDWVTFRAHSGTSYLIVADSPGPDAEPILALHDACRFEPPFGYGQQISWTAPSDGVYYLQVMNHRAQVYGPTTNYDLRVEEAGGCRRDEYESDDSPAEARDIPLGGALQYHDACPAGDADWVRFDAAGGIEYTLTTTDLAAASDTVLCLYSTDGTTQIECDDDGGQGSGSRIVWSSPSTGTYYARVTQFDTGVSGPDTSYGLSVVDQRCQGDAYEDDGSSARARAISIDGPPQDHNFCPARDEDWVVFDATAGLTYTIQTTDLGSECDTTLTLYDADGTTQLAFNDDYAAGLASRIDYTFPVSGSYYVKAQHFSADRYGLGTEYRLSVQEDAPPHPPCPHPLDDATITGPSSGYTDTLYTFGTVIMPPDATAPITYTWSPEPVSGQGTSSAGYRWAMPGTYTITLTAENCGGVAEDIHTIAIQREPDPEYSTLILVNRERLATIYGEAGAQQVMGKLEELRTHDRVQGHILQVEAYASVAAAYNEWIADPLNTVKANGVASAVRNLVMAALEDNPGIDSILIVGRDEVIPFRRVLDRTGYPESHYEMSASAGTTLQAACRDDMSLTDDYYADREPSEEGGHETYIPDYALGRLVETPEEIVALIDTFLAEDRLTADGVLVTGYDFVQPEAQDMCDEWTADLSSAIVDCTLMGGSWTAATLRDMQLNTVPRFDVQSINGHANHRQEGAPGLGSVSADDIAGSGASALDRAVIYTLGCHSGFNDVGPDGIGQTGLDLAQAFAQRRANYVANTGYGWGCQGSGCLSEELMYGYTQELSRGGSALVGGALKAAKQSYYLEDGNIDGYDQRILIESTLYGLPMYELMTGGTLEEEDPFPSVAITITSPEDFASFSEGHVDISLVGALGAYSETRTADGSYFSLDGHTRVDAGRPVQPQFHMDVSSPGAGTARGAILAGGSYARREGFNPVSAQPVNEYYAPPEPDFTYDGWYPPVPFMLQGQRNVSTTVEMLVAVMGQYNSDEGSERLYESMSLDLYYSGSPDRTPPTIESASARREGARVDFKVAVSDPSGVHRVVVVYTDGSGAWTTKDLDYVPLMDKWTGSISSESEIEWLVQAVDEAGNVAVANDKSAYYVPQDRVIYSVYLPLLLRLR